VAEPEGPVRWIQVRFITDGELAEALADVLGRFVYNKVVVESVMKFDAHTQQNIPTGRVIVSGYVPVDEHLESTRQKMEEAFWHLGQITPIPKPTYTPVRDQDWMAAWKQHYTPVPVGEKLLILPAWQSPEPDEDRILIRINPTMAFGTGTHPSTQLILVLLEKYIQPGQPLIDIGCGSGILSITALKLGATRAVAVDIDGAAIVSTLENARLNDISEDILETGKGSVEEILTGRFSFSQAPLVLVNILAPIISRLFDQNLANLVAFNGVLLLSGILDHQEAEMVAKAQENGFERIKRINQADWVSLAFHKVSN
jgi:ribosomal protein L11 methyltransferase